MEGIAGDVNSPNKWKTPFSMVLQFYLDKSTPLPVHHRWLGTFAVEAIYVLRVYYVKGFFYIISYGLGIYISSENSKGPIAAESSHLNVGTGPSIELNSIKSKHNFIKLVFDVSLNSTLDIDLFLKELEAGKYPIWSNLDSDTRSKVHEAMSGLFEVYEMNTNAINSNSDDASKVLLTEKTSNEKPQSKVQFRKAKMRMPVHEKFSYIRRSIQEQGDIGPVDVCARLCISTYARDCTNNLLLEGLNLGLNYRILSPQSLSLAACTFGLLHYNTMIDRHDISITLVVRAKSVGNLSVVTDGSPIEDVRR
ncbi:Retrieval of early ER protein Rer1 [Artemisia annua]|uniref:Retrieval of early ER protein Rer1 n=1 Tax=Artemisia annua TaxID=35608 RepID=A0A2U1NPE9_ARTAN|nr:Retrieval of early ER protein Rer1 [Artemisia annua]